MKSRLRKAVAPYIAVSFALFFFLAECVAQSVRAHDSVESMQAFLAGMPKAELHLHLEGTLSAATIVEITNRNGIDYFTTAAEIEQSLADRPPGLMGFLEHHFKSQNVMQTRQDFYDATYNLIEKLHENNVIYADLFFDPQAHTARGIPFDEMFKGIDDGRRDAKAKFGVTVNLIMCINRERSIASAFEMLDQAHAVRDKIIGLGMDSGPEYGNPPVKFRDVYARAREEGYFLTGHHDVDVRDSVKHIWQSLDIIGMDRIDHGLNASDDPKLVTELARRGMCLTGSPVKRASDPEPQDIDRIRALDDAGVCVSLNSDDPAEFESGYLTNMLILFQQASAFSKSDMTRLMFNAFDAIWLPQADKENFIGELREYATQNDVDWRNVTRQ
jgi:adenosine deaminase